MNLGRRWYVVAWDGRREDWRTFRADRVDRPAATGVRFAGRELPATDAAAFVQASIAGAWSRYEARVTVHASAEALAARLPHLAGALTPIDEHRCEYLASDDDPGWLAIRIAMLGADIDVDGPPEVIAQLRTLADRLGRAAGRAGRTPGAGRS